MVHRFCFLLLIATSDSIVLAPKPVVVENLFPRRPQLNFWHQPYARGQPRFDPDGFYAIDFDKIEDKPLAVVKMDVASLNLDAESEYSLAFAGNLSSHGGVVAKLPAADSNQYVSTQSEFTKHRFTFRYDPQQNTNETTFVFPKEAIARGGKVSFRNFQINASQ